VKVNYLTLLAGATMALLTAASARAQAPAASALAADATAAPAATTALSTTASAAPMAAAKGDVATYYDDSDPVQDFIARVGAWAVHSTGSPTEIGQYQDVRQSSPFFDIDGIKSDGDRTLDISLVGTDNEANDARVNYYGPKLEAKVDYERYLDQLYQDSYAGWASISTATSAANSKTFNVASRDNLNPTQDYAIRVQEWKADFKGNLTDNLKWYVNTFGLEKDGYRQANAVSHCFPAGTPGASYGGITYAGTTGNTAQCHAVSQAQHIDWQTTEVEPGLELRVGELTVNYSHMIRDFRAGDSMALSLYNTNSSGFQPPTYTAAPGGNPKGFTVAGNNIVPNTLTQMDRLKAHADVGCKTDIYAMGYAGDTTDDLNGMDRHYDGGDLRITNRSIENLTVTGYGRAYGEHTNLQQNPSLSSADPSLAYFYQQPAVPVYSGTLSSAAQTVPPVIDRDREAVGASTRWLPFGDDCNWVRRHFAVTGGYEYGTEHYQATPGGPGYPNSLTYAVAYAPSNSTFVQPDTIKNTFSIGLEEKWSDNFQTYIRFKNIETKYPFIGVTPAVAYSEGAALNTCLPTVENRVELGGTYTVCDAFMLNATIFLETASNNGIYAGPNSNHFDSNSFPFVLSAWWSPTPQWSFNAGFAEMDSWIDQQVVQSVLGGNPPTPYFIPATFNNRSDLFDLGTRYAWTSRLSTCATVEYVHSSNDTSIPVPYTGGAYDVGQYSLVASDTVRFTLGVDYLLRPGFTTFARYNFYNFEDFNPVPTTGPTSGATSTNATGQTNMFLVGASAKF
jgi:hypothetical protein